MTSPSGTVSLTCLVALTLNPVDCSSVVAVSALCPGYTDTPMLQRTIDGIMDKTGRSREQAQAPLLAGNPLGRFIEPAEVADAALWLAGPHAGAINGQAIAIAGGEAM